MAKKPHESWISAHPLSIMSNAKKRKADAVDCPFCGMKVKRLSRHLKRAHGMDYYDARRAIADSEASIKPPKSSTPKKSRTSKANKAAKIRAPTRKPIAEDKKVSPTGTKRAPATLDQILSGGPGIVSAVDPSEEWISRKKRRKSPEFVDYEKLDRPTSDHPFAEMPKVGSIQDKKRNLEKRRKRGRK